MSKTTDKFFVDEIRRLQCEVGRLNSCHASRKNQIDVMNEKINCLSEKLIFVASLFERSSYNAETSSGKTLKIISAHVSTSDDKFDVLDDIVTNFGEGVKSWEDLEQEKND